MGFFAQCAVGMLAAAGLICILKTVYDIIFHSTVCVRGKAELYLYLDGSAAEAEQLMRQVRLARRTYLPGLTVIPIHLDGAQQEHGGPSRTAER